MGIYSADPSFETALSRAEITDYESAMAYSGGRLLAAHRGRSVVRIEGSLFLKRFIKKDREARRERESIALLEGGDGPDPAPLAAWGEGEKGAFLITAAPVGCRPLPEALRLLAGLDHRGVVEAAGARIGELHDRGLTCPDLLAHHLLVGLPDRVHLIDAGRLARRFGRRARERDLAALELSLPFGVATRTDRLRFLRSSDADRSRRRALVKTIARAHDKLDRRSRHRTDRLVAAPAEMEFLAQHGIRNFTDIMEHEGPGSERLRLLPDRENRRVELGGRVFFVKRHQPQKGLARTPAAAEWSAIDVFRRSGIRAMRPVAMGEDVRRGSTIWVERAPGEPLDDVIRAGVPAPVRREMIREAAGILRRMRLQEIHHRDMYACHLIADVGAAPGERLTVIDLQRARKIPGLRSRWYVKDVAQLLHSAPRRQMTRSDLVRFLRVYFDVGKLGPKERAFARAVERKAASIARRNREPFERE